MMYYMIIASDVTLILKRLKWGGNSGLICANSVKFVFMIGVKITLLLSIIFIIENHV